MAATFLITAGTDIRTVAGKLGHASTNTTSLVYSHLLKSAEKETDDLMQSIITDVRNMPVKKDLGQKNKKQAK